MSEHSKNDDRPPSADPLDDLPVLYRYSRKEALGDGMLIDVTPFAAEVGFCLPVAVTIGLWGRFIVPTNELRSQGQSESARMHDVLSVLWVEISRLRAAGTSSDRVAFQTAFLMPPDRYGTAHLIAVCGPGDEGEAVLTLMLEGED